ELSQPPPQRPGERSAARLVDSIGVNVHFNYLDTAYARQVEVIDRLRELGVRHLRDGQPLAGQAIASVLPAAAREGMLMTLITDVARDPAADVEQSVRVLGDHIAAFEGPNELDLMGDPGWAGKLTAYMPALDAAVRERAPGARLIGPSLVNGSSRLELPEDLPGLFNAHPYALGQPPEAALGNAVRAARPAQARKGIYFTEIGYHNAYAATTGQPPVSEEAAAVYLPRALVAAFGAGVRRTFVYELLDEKPDPAFGDPEQHFGLLRNDLSPKPAFTAIKTLIAALRSSPGSGSGSLPWDVRAPDDAHVQRLMLARRDGSRAIALWRPVSVWDADERQAEDPGSVPVKLLLGRTARDLTVWRPSVSEQPVLRRAQARRLTLDLAGDLVLVSFR
ncbi:MAG: hypothetical protein QOE60_3006, partial [Thermoleophilaceae bacterium]|nr:hypothetical protein [Thermoleophilaceae bacterium]